MGIETRPSCLPPSAGRTPPPVLTDTKGDDTTSRHVLWVEQSSACPKCLLCVSTTVGLTCPATPYPQASCQGRPGGDNHLPGTRWLLKALEPGFHPQRLRWRVSPGCSPASSNPLTARPPTLHSDDTGVACGTQGSKAMAFSFGNTHVSSSPMTPE